MKYFLDTEFIEDGRTIDLISIGLVAEDGRSLYHQNEECSFTRASEWVWRNVFPHLAHFNLSGTRRCSRRETVRDSGLYRSHITKCSNNVDDPCPWATRFEIRDAVREFCDQEKYGNPEFWGYYADYDWVAFCQLFGAMIDLPKGFPMYCRDLKQEADRLDLRLPQPEKDVHHALGDAEQIKEWHAFLFPPKSLKPESMSYGEILYNAYCKARDWKSVRGEPLAHFQQQSPELQASWEASAKAVADQIRNQTSPG